MTAVKANDVERAVKARSAEINVLLFFGPDAGRIAERARAAAEAATDDPGDPFQLIRIDGDALADNPSRLVEEATTFGMFGGRRALWVRPTSRSLVPAVAACLDVNLIDSLVVVEGGDLAKTAPLRTLCERSPRALALPCYADEARDIAGLIDETLRRHGLTIEEPARHLLTQSLGGDRLASRAELDKLALYVHGQGRVTVADVEATVIDVSALALDAALDAAFGGDRVALEDNLAQLQAHGGTGQILPIALRHALSLLSASAAVSQGEPLDGALRGWRGLNFRRKDAVGRQLRVWRTRELLACIDTLQAAVLDTRLSAALAASLTSRVLIGISETARRASNSR